MSLHASGRTTVRVDAVRGSVSRSGVGGGASLSARFLARPTTSSGTTAASARAWTPTLPLPPPELNTFAGRKFVLDYSLPAFGGTAARRDELRAQLQALEAILVGELDASVQALVVDDEPAVGGVGGSDDAAAAASSVIDAMNAVAGGGGGRGSASRAREFTAHVSKSAGNRMLVAAAAASASSLPLASSPTDAISPRPSSVVHAPEAESRRAQAARLGVAVWSRSHLASSLAAVLDSTSSRRDLPPCRLPRVIVEDEAGAFRPTMLVFEPITPIVSSNPASSASSHTTTTTTGAHRPRGSAAKNMPVFAHAPIHTFPTVDLEYRGSGSPFVRGNKRIDARPVPTPQQATPLPPTPTPAASSQKKQPSPVVVLAERKSHFCEVCEDSFNVSESEHFQTAKHRTRYLDPTFWEGRARLDEMSRVAREDEAFWDTWSISPSLSEEEAAEAREAMMETMRAATEKLERGGTDAMEALAAAEEAANKAAQRLAPMLPPSPVIEPAVVEMETETTPTQAPAAAVDASIPPVPPSTADAIAPAAVAPSTTAGVALSVAASPPRRSVVSSPFSSPLLELAALRCLEAESDATSPSKRQRKRARDRERAQQQQQEQQRAKAESTPTAAATDAAVAAADPPAIDAVLSVATADTSDAEMRESPPVASLPLGTPSVLPSSILSIGSIRPSSTPLSPLPASVFVSPRKSPRRAAASRELLTAAVGSPRPSPKRSPGPSSRAAAASRDATLTKQSEAPATTAAATTAGRVAGHAKSASTESGSSGISSPPPARSRSTSKRVGKGLTPVHPTLGRIAPGTRLDAHVHSPQPSLLEATTSSSARQKLVLDAPPPPPPTALPAPARASPRVTTRPPPAPLAQTESPPIAPAKPPSGAASRSSSASFSPLVSPSLPRSTELRGLASYLTTPDAPVYYKDSQAEVDINRLHTPLAPRRAAQAAMQALHAAASKSPAAAAAMPPTLTTIGAMPPAATSKSSPAPPVTTTIVSPPVHRPKLNAQEKLLKSLGSYLTTPESPVYYKDTQAEVDITQLHTPLAPRRAAAAAVQALHAAAAKPPSMTAPISGGAATKKRKSTQVDGATAASADKESEPASKARRTDVDELSAPPPVPHSSSSPRSSPRKLTRSNSSTAEAVAEPPPVAAAAAAFVPRSSPRKSGKATAPEANPPPVRSRRASTYASSIASAATSSGSFMVGSAAAKAKPTPAENSKSSRSKLPPKADEPPPTNDAAAATEPAAAAPDSPSRASSTPSRLAPATPSRLSRAPSSATPKPAPRSSPRRASAHAVAELPGHPEAAPTDAAPSDEPVPANEEPESAPVVSSTTASGRKAPPLTLAERIQRELGDYLVSPPRLGAAAKLSRRRRSSERMFEAPQADATGAAASVPPSSPPPPAEEEEATTSEEQPESSTAVAAVPLSSPPRKPSVLRELARLAPYFVSPKASAPLGSERRARSSTRGIVDAPPVATAAPVSSSSSSSSSTRRGSKPVAKLLFPAESRGRQRGKATAASAARNASSSSSTARSDESRSPSPVAEPSQPAMDAVTPQDELVDSPAMVIDAPEPDAAALTSGSPAKKRKSGAASRKSISPAAPVARSASVTTPIVLPPPSSIPSEPAFAPEPELVVSTPVKPDKVESSLLAPSVIGVVSSGDVQAVLAPYVNSPSPPVAPESAPQPSEREAVPVPEPEPEPKPEPAAPLVAPSSPVRAPVSADPEQLVVVTIDRVLFGTMGLCVKIVPTRRLKPAASPARRMARELARLTQYYLPPTNSPSSSTSSDAKPAPRVLASPRLQALQRGASPSTGTTGRPRSRPSSRGGSPAIKPKATAAAAPTSITIPVVATVTLPAATTATTPALDAPAPAQSVTLTPSKSSPVATPIRVKAPSLGRELARLGTYLETPSHRVGDAPEAVGDLTMLQTPRPRRAAVERRPIESEERASNAASASAAKSRTPNTTASMPRGGRAKSKEAAASPPSAAAPTPLSRSGRAIRAPRAFEDDADTPSLAASPATVTTPAPAIETASKRSATKRKATTTPFISKRDRLVAAVYPAGDDAAAAEEYDNESLTSLQKRVKLTLPGGGVAVAGEVEMGPVKEVTQSTDVTTDETTSLALATTNTGTRGLKRGGEHALASEEDADVSASPDSKRPRLSLAVPSSDLVAPPVLPPPTASPSASLSPLTAPPGNGDDTDASTNNRLAAHAPTPLFVPGSSTEDDLLLAAEGEDECLDLLGGDLDADPLEFASCEEKAFVSPKRSKMSAHALMLSSSGASGGGGRGTPSSAGGPDRTPLKHEQNLRAHLARRQRAETLIRKQLALASTPLSANAAAASASPGPRGGLPTGACTPSSGGGAGSGGVGHFRFTVTPQHGSSHSHLPPPTPTAFGGGLRAAAGITPSLVAAPEDDDACHEELEDLDHPPSKPSTLKVPLAMLLEQAADEHDEEGKAAGLLVARTDDTDEARPLASFEHME